MNCKLLIHYIKENHDRVETLASALGVDCATWTLKINAKRGFNKREVDFICERYNFGAELTMKIFF